MNSLLLKSRASEFVRFGACLANPSAESFIELFLLVPNRRLMKVASFLYVFEECALTFSNSFLLESRRSESSLARPAADLFHEPPFCFSRLADK